MKKIDITTPYKGLSKFYFEKIIDTIIKEGNLFKKNLNILDYGCGLKYLENKLNKKIFNYDIDKNLSEITNWNKRAYDIVVLNHVIMYMNENILLNYDCLCENRNGARKNEYCILNITILATYCCFSYFKYSFTTAFHITSKFYLHCSNTVRSRINVNVILI